MDDDGHAWVGRRNKRRLRTGAHVRVVVTAVNPIEGLIDLELALTPTDAPSHEASGSRPIYGLHAVRVDAACGIRSASSPCGSTQRRDDPRAREIEELAQKRGRPVQRVDAHALKQALGDVAHQGVVADIEPLPPWTEDDLLAALDERARIRCCSCSMACRIRTISAPACARPMPAARWRWSCRRIAPRSSTPPSRKVAAGAAETTPVVAVTNLARALKLLKEAGLWVVGADADGPKLAHEADLDGGVALVLGAEGAGLRQLTRQTCDFLVRLPQLGAVESLNVSVAAGMLLYEAVRQRSRLRPETAALAARRLGSIPAGS